ncbi:phosphomevalonate kinase isoform X2 [Bombus vancouverensis nearcticus]|uniref:Phosphomevalonate kinase n=1 Tax=Bombus bifarius TaxID=103933 RepID=A0A6P8MMH3_9HYME|nr:phosphomevalonate kinase [Bombus vancouverensis nearcticus]XP_033309533.1 phosphomevalonate kinase [Bombus bifarius]XP_050491463.1 phosphomevalonate kinase [Bombus huntii]
MATDNIPDDREISHKGTFKPQIILLFSGKRKSGKDYITNALHERIGHDKSEIIRLSGPIKFHWAKSLGLDIDQLLGDGKYKENYRLEMAKWGENIRNKDYGYFCRAALEMYNAYSKPIWIVSDTRRKTDIQWFMENFKNICKIIRIESDDSIRNKRGWMFTPGIDDSETECNLDDVDIWDLKVINNNESIEYILEQILKLIN